MKYILLLIFILPLAANAQHLRIKGTVTDETDEPIGGATIRLLKSNSSITTAADGIFLLPQAVAGDTVEISYVGYQTRRLALTNPPFRVQLQKKDGTLEEVVIANTGYQKVKPNEVTGSITVVDNALYNQQVGFNVLERIKGITNGISTFSSRVGSAPASDILVRGLSTLTRTIQKPLIVLDDFEYQGELDNINPNDIENITVLKDAAASSIWGARAANGVIVITTKRASFNKRTTINFTSNITVSQAPDLKVIREIAPADLVELEKYLFERSYRFADTATPQRSSFSPVYEALFALRKGTIPASEADRLLNEYSNHDVRDDFSKLFYRNAVNQQYAVSINGGASNIAWGISMGLDRNISVLSQKTDRHTVSFNNTYKPIKKLTINLSVMYSSSRNQSGAPAYGSVRGPNNGLPIYTQLENYNGTALPIYNTFRQGYIDTVGGGRLLDWRYYPATDYLNTPITNLGQNLNAGLSMDYRLLPWLNVKMNYRYQLESRETEALNTASSYFTRDMINRFTQITTTTRYGIPKGDILDYSQSNIAAQNLRGQLVAEQRWHLHHLSAIAGAEMSDARTRSRSDRSYGYSPDILTYTNVDLVNVQPQFFGGSARVPDTKSINSGTARFVSFFANGLYSFKDRYSISASARRDASNSFGVATNDRWKPLWSTGLAWEVSKEPFYTFKSLAYLKLRASYGHQGNVDLSKVAVITTRYRGTITQTGLPYADIENFPNPDLRWEQTAIFNLGLDYGVAGRRLSGSIEYYRKDITDLYGEAPVDPTTGTGMTTITKNMGNARAQGFDITINTINLQGDFKWNTRLFVNTNRMKVLKYRDIPQVTSALVAVSFTPINGYSPYSLFAYRWAGLDPTTGDPQGYLNKEVTKDYASIISQTDMASLVYLGSQIPTVSGNISNDFSYKRFSLTVSMNYRLGYYIRKNSIDYSSLVFQLTGHSDYARRWQQPGDEQLTYIPSFTYPVSSQRDAFYRASEVLTGKGDHLRLSYINLAYELPTRSAGAIRALRLFAVANNLGIIWKKDKLVTDPDIGDRSVPPARTFSTGINISF